MQAHSPQAAVEPKYVEARRGEVWAHFASGVSVEAGRDRRRSYPGLRCQAPPTLPFYRAALSSDPAARVADLGCGAGAGTRLLTTHFDAVAAVERDARAVEFARHYAPLAQLHRFDLERPFDIGRVDLGLVVDVLGHLSDPALALCHMRENLADDGRLLLAEPAAHVAQQLVAPARRAFSRRALVQVLTRSGFRLASWLCERGTFLSCVAIRERLPEYEALAEATLYLNRDRDHARAALAQAGDTGNADVKLEALLLTADLALADRDGDAAVAALLGARRIAPDDPCALTRLSEIAALSGDKRQAVEFAFSAVERDRTDALACAALARAAESVAHPDALGAWRIAARLAPDDADIVANCARAAAEQLDYASGIVSFEQLRAYGDPLSAAFHVTLAWLLLSDGRLADARVEARMAAAIAPEDAALPELWNALGEAARPAGRR